MAFAIYCSLKDDYNILIMIELKNYSFPIFFLSTLITGIIFLSPAIDFQALISIGDHGLNLYAADAILRGDRPYYDFYWSYGPLMPYYYALVFKLLGSNILNLLFGIFILDLTAGLLLFCCLRLFTTNFLAFAGSAWYYSYHLTFFYTYNHAGGIPLLFAIMLTLLLYLKSAQQKYLFAGLICIFILSLNKINFAFSSLAAFVISVFVIDFFEQRKLKRHFYLYSVLGMPLIMILVNWLSIYKLPFYVIRQCFLYFGTDPFVDIYPNIGDVILSSLKLIKSHITSTWMDTVLCVLIVTSMGFCFKAIFQKNWKKSTQRQFFLLVLILSLFYVASLHEYLISGILYRRLWAKPFSMLLIFIIIHFAFKGKKLRHQTLIACFILFLSIVSFYQDYKKIQKYKTQDQYFFFKKGKIFSSNSKEWIHTVSRTLFYIQYQLEKDELFFTLPYEPLYYYLSDTPSPTRQLVFFKFINIIPEQEKNIIRELKENKIRWIVISNRISSTEEGLGTFGKDYCPLIAQYIFENFEPVAEFGDWTKPGGWAWDHATRIYKRK